MLSLVKYNKITDIDKFIEENKSELERLPGGNCYFSNIVTSILLRNIEPTIVFGSFLGFSVEKMVDAWDILCDYVDYYLNYAWGINNEFIIKLKPEDFDSTEIFKRELLKQLKHKDTNSLIGICLAAENVFYRNDIDLGFWGFDYISHFSIICNLDFENDSCILLDSTPAYDKSTSTPISQNITITKILSYLRKDKIYLKKDKDFVWLLDIDALISLITDMNSGTEDMIEKNINSLYNQAKDRLNNVYTKSVSPISWLKSKWDDFEDLDKSFEENWFDPRLNIFQIIAAHRYYVSIFIEKYAKNYFEASVDILLELLKKEEGQFDKLKYLCYKLSISNKSKNIELLKTNIKNVLTELDSIELQISEFIIKNVKKPQL